ncbi:MAG: DUF4375 domain-containing protein [Phycisphaeraceae bacterium]|nr:DUF4375 domain-containing protein [Phycisphaerales bacterium]MCB9843113.1 DUF4375 domain-containing protein [Phycisphaeraceae bacterium]
MVDEDSPANASMAARCLFGAFGPDGITAEEFTVICAADLDVQVMNGGFRQYLVNPSKHFAENAPAALTEIGAPNAASVVREFLNICTVTEENLGPRSHGLIVRHYKLPSDRDSESHKYDQRYDQAEPVWSLIREYIIANRPSIRTYAQAILQLKADGLDAESRQHRHAEAVARLNAQWANRERPCPKCGQLFRSVSCRGRCPKCGHTFYASHPNEYESFPW